jgi:DNA-binding transcriptional ArsR family regulator
MLSQSELELRLEADAALLSNMANYHRLHILMILREGEASVSSMVPKVRLSQSALSQHLARLRNGKLVATRREGQTIYYSCKSPAVFELLNVLTEIHRAPAEAIDRSEGRRLAQHMHLQAATEADLSIQHIGVVDETDDRLSASEPDVARRIYEDR